MEYSCSECYEKRKGDCFGKTQICEDFQLAVTMSESDKESWPMVMRSSHHYKKVQHDIEEKKRASRAQDFPIKKDTVQRKPGIKAYVKNIDSPNKEISSDKFEFEYIQIDEINIEKLEKEYLENIIIWISGGIFMHQI